MLIEEYINGSAGGAINLTNYLKKSEASSLYLSKEEAEVTYAPINILQQVYPVGAIYISTVNTNPNLLFGFGTWEAIEDRFLLGASATYVAGTTGGETSHILTVDEMPSHSHTFLRHQFDRNDGDNGTDVYGANNKTLPQVNATTDATGGGQAHNNMPPYLVVYMWKRIQ